MYLLASMLLLQLLTTTIVGVHGFSIDQRHRFWMVITPTTKAGKVQYGFGHNNPFLQQQGYSGGLTMATFQQTPTTTRTDHHPTTSASETFHTISNGSIQDLNDGILQLSKKENHDSANDHPSLSSMSLLQSIGWIALPIVTMASPAYAAGAGVIPNALVAYVHYASLLVCVAALMFQRILVQPNISPEEEDHLFASEVVLGVATMALLGSGYLRTVEFDKGLGFYIHEPLFWFKIILSAVWGGSSLFPSILIVKRYLERKTASSPQQQKQQAPISTALAARLHQVLNAELTALLFIPLIATLVARGVWYVDDFPWQAGAAISAITWLGLSFKYGKDALAWNDPDVVVQQSAALTTSPEPKGSVSADD